MPTTFGGPRVLLRRLREVMAQPTLPQEKLDRIVILIASNMVAEVCSIYVQRDDKALELFATEGLKREAVHLTTMKAGEGLVGLIAREAEALALSDAQSHPSFSYKPETGEEIYRSFLGVPILRAGLCPNPPFQRPAARPQPDAVRHPCHSRLRRHCAPHPSAAPTETPADRLRHAPLLDP